MKNLINPYGETLRLRLRVTVHDFFSSLLRIQERIRWEKIRGIGIIIRRIGIGHIWIIVGIGIRAIVFLRCSGIVIIQEALLVIGTACVQECKQREKDKNFKGIPNHSKSPPISSLLNDIFPPA